MKIGLLKMRLFRVCSLVCILAFSLGAQAQNTIKEITLDGFNHLVVSGPFDLQVSQGAIPALTIKGSAADIERLNIEQKPTTLSISLHQRDKSEHAFFMDASILKLKLVVSSLKSVMKQGSGDIFFKALTLGDFKYSSNGSGDTSLGLIDAHEVVFSAHGSGDVHIVSIKASQLKISSQGSGDLSIASVNTEELSIDMKGSGDLEIVKEGTAATLNLAVMGSGDYSSKLLKNKVANVSVKGSGDVEINVSDSLRAAVFGSGDIIYDGDAKVVSSTFGSGDVKPAH